MNAFIPIRYDMKGDKMGDFKMRAHDTNNIERIYGWCSWRKKYEPVITEILKAGFMEIDYPNVEIDGLVFNKEIIRITIINMKFGSSLEIMSPKLSKSGRLEYQSLTFEFPSENDGFWKVHFEDYAFTATLRNVKATSKVNGLCIIGIFAGVDLFSKIRSVCQLMKKLELFFLYSVEYSPEMILDIICKELSMNQKNLGALDVSFGINTALHVEMGKITEAILQNKYYTIRLTSSLGVVEYSEENFVLSQNQERQNNYMQYNTYFQKLDTIDVAQQVNRAQQRIAFFLCEVATLNERDNSKKITTE